MSLKYPPEQVTVETTQVPDTGVTITSVGEVAVAGGVEAAMGSSSSHRAQKSVAGLKGRVGKVAGTAGGLMTGFERPA